MLFFSILFLDYSLHYRILGLGNSLFFFCFLFLFFLTSSDFYGIHLLLPPTPRTLSAGLLNKCCILHAARQNQRIFSPLEFELLAVAYGFFHKPIYAGVIELNDALLHMQYLFINYRGRLFLYS